jgi:O-antigen ligase
LFLNDYQGYHFTGGNIRLAIWKICIEAVNAENAWIIGVGPGDTQTILTKRYIEKNIYPGDEIHEGFLHYNAHNQFLQYYMSLGIIGLGFFIIILGFLVVTIFTKANITAGCISIVFLSFCFTESVMERQKGIVFFTFFSCLLVAKTSTKVVNIRTLG